MSENKYSWVETHKQIAHYLSTKENSQKELIELLKSVGIGPFNDKVKQGSADIELEEIDPFTFFCYIYKYGSDKRLKYLQKISEQLKITIPNDELGIPSANAQKVWLFPYKYERENNEIKRLWNFFKKAVNRTVTDADFADILTIRNVGKTKISEALYYINPDEYFPINGPSKPYLKSILSIEPYFETYTDYIELMGKIKSKINVPFYELSYLAWKWNNDQTNVNYWIFQGNPNIYNVVAALNDNMLTTWNVKAHEDKIKIGDKLILWVTGKDQGCYALGEIVSDVFDGLVEEDQVKYYAQQNKNAFSKQVKIKITKNLSNNPIKREVIQNINELKEMKVGNQGTNFSATEEEYETMLSLANKRQLKKYWLYAPGENAELWEEFYLNGIMGLGWDELGDLNHYSSKEELAIKLQEIEKTTGSKKNDASANYDFKYGISIGDVIIVKKGRGQLLGYGIVTSDYFYDSNRTSYQSCRRVDWKKKGVWPTNHNLALKTLTDITKYESEHPDYKTYYERLMGLMDGGNDSNDNKALFTGWLKKKYGHQSGTISSYIKAIDIISKIISKNIFKETDDSFLEQLYADLIFEQQKGKGKYYHKDAPSYGSNGFYSASIKAYREFLKYNPTLKPVNEMQFSLNTILYGPPGTGKTYNTILRAAEIIENRKIDTYDEALKIYRENLHNQIEFITFHQNYSYEDFIQGLRPETDNKSALTFDKKDGIFKKIADTALENLLLSEKAPDELSNDALFDSALEKFKDIVEDTDAYRINESVYIMEVEEDAFRYTGDNWTNHASGIRMKFSDLREFYRSEVKSRKDVKRLINITGLASQHATYYFLVYEKILKHLPQKVEAPIKIERKNYVIIIDEINRANISRVFGELITLIEPDKRSHGDMPLQARLPSGDYFTVPSNLYIIGTMNTADKSIALLDIALRRRFEFEPMYPLYTIQNAEVYDKDILLKINEEIVKSKGPDFQIGHAYFMGENKDLLIRMNKKVIPLLLEYYMNDVKEVKEILHNAGLQVEENSWPLKITGKRA